MRLTIKDQPNKQEQQNSKNSYKQYKFSYLDPNCCSLGPQGSRHTLNVPHSKQEQLLYNLVKIDCLSIYSRVNPKQIADELCRTIMNCISKLKLRYQPWIGYLSAHCLYHFPQQKQRRRIIQAFVSKFRDAFELTKCAVSIFNETLARVKMYCSDAQVIPSQIILSSLCQRHQTTMLLEFLPVDYSKYIIQRYLAEDGDIEQYVRLFTSLIHFVLNTSNPINQDHFVDLMQRPFMGTVQWPIIIANRHMFQSQPVMAPVVRTI